MPPSPVETAPARRMPRSFIRRRWRALLAGVTLAPMVVLALGLIGARVYLSGPRLTALVQTQLAGRFAGAVHIGRVAWELPLTLRVENCSVGLDAATPEATLHRLTARLQLSALLARRIAIGPVVVEGARVHLRPRAGGDPNGFALLEALAPQSPAAPAAHSTTQDEAGFDWPIIISGVEAHDIDVHLQAEHQDIVLSGIYAEAIAGRIALEPQQLQVSGRLGAASCSLRMDALPHPVAVGPVRVRLDNVKASLDDAGQQLQATLAAIDLPGLKVEVGGVLWAAAGQAPEASGHLDLHADATSLAPWMQPAWPTVWAQLQPKGQAAVRLDGRSAAGRHSGVLHLRGTDFAIAQVPVDSLAGAAAWEAPVLRFDDWRLQLAGGELSAHGTVQIDPQRGDLGQHQVAVGLKQFPLRDLVRTALVDGTEQAPFFPRALDGRLALAGSALWPNYDTTADVGLRATGLASAQVPALPESVALSLAAHAHGQRVDGLRLEVQADGATLTASGAAGLGPEDALALQASLKHPTPNRTLARVAPTLRAADVAIDLTAAGTWRRPAGHGHIALTGLQVGADANARIDVAVPLTLQHGILRARHLQIVGPALRAYATLQATLQNRRGGYLATPELDGDVRLARADIGAFAANVAAGQAEARLRLFGPLAAPGGAGQLRIHGLSLGSLHFAEVNTQVSSDGQRFSLRHLALLPRDGGQILGEAQVDRHSRAIHLNLRVRDVPVRWLGLVTPTPALVQASLAIGGSLDDMQAALEARAGRVFGLDADLRLQPTSSQMALRLTGTGELGALGEWVQAAAGLHGVLAVGVQATGYWGAPHLAATLQADGLSLNGLTLGNGQLRLAATTPSAGSYQVDLDAMQLLAVHSRIAVAPVLRIDAHASFDRLHASALIAGLAEHGADATVTGSADLHYSGALGAAAPQLTAQLAVAALEAQAAGRDIALAAPTRLVLGNTAVSLEPLTLTGTAGRLDLRGQVLGPWQVKSPEAASATQLQAEASGKVDLAFVAALVPALGHASGTAVWAGDLGGTRDKPEGQGTLRIADVWTVRPRGTLIEVQVASGSIVLTSHRLQLQDIRGSLESGTFTLGGHVDLEHLRPQHYDVHLTGNDLPVRTADLMLEANVNARARGDGLIPHLTGRIDITRGRFLKKLEFKDFNFVAPKELDTSAPLAESAPWLKELGLDLMATSSNGVDIRLDAGAFAVDATLQTDLRITGNALLPHIVGRINAERGSLHFPKADLQLSQAVIDFEPTPKDPLGAALTLQADGEVTPAGGGGTGTQTYNVALRVDGPVNALNFELTSDQGLGKLEVLSLLTTGHVSLAELTGQSEDGSQLDAALAFAGSQVSGPLTHLAERQLERALNLRLELGAEVTQENIRLTAAKNLNRRLRLEGAYTHGIAAEQAVVSTRAQLSLTDRLLLEGSAARDLSGAAAAGGSNAVQSNLELKYRLVGH